MATFVLVHGAWQGGWAYKRVARLLRAEGHDVYTPTCTGLGERSHLNHPGITLTTHIQDVAGVLEYENLSDVILVGHSYGGMVITGVSAKAAQRIKALVYLDAFLPEDGQSLFDISFEGSLERFVESQKPTPGLVPFMGAPGASNAAPSGQSRRKPDLHPLLTLTEPVRLDGSERAIGRRTYILATRRPGFQRFYDRVKDQDGWTAKTIDTGHAVMLEDPEGLARLLLEEV